MNGAANGFDVLAGRRVLVLEDEVIIALELQLSFEDVGATVEIAESVEVALDVLRQTELDAAVLDVNLGRGETCAEVARRLVEDGIPFVLHSGDLVRHGELVETIKAPVIAKPAAPQDLIDEVGRLLSEARSGSAA